MSGGPEAEIVWLEDIDKLDYVRVWETDLPHRGRRPSKRHDPGRLVGRRREDVVVRRGRPCGRDHDDGW